MKTFTLLLSKGLYKLFFVCPEFVGRAIDDSIFFMVLFLFSLKLRPLPTKIIIPLFYGNRTSYLQGHNIFFLFIFNDISLSSPRNGGIVNMINPYNIFIFKFIVSYYS